MSLTSELDLIVSLTLQLVLKQQDEALHNNRIKIIYDLETVKSTVKQERGQQIHLGIEQRFKLIIQSQIETPGNNNPPIRTQGHTSGTNRSSV